MLKRNITYTNFNGDEVTEEFYFNLTRTEIINMDVGIEGGMEAALKRIVATQDPKELVNEFQNIILASYGVKTPDGKRFEKSIALREAFAQSAAYDSLFIELATNDESAAAFVKGIIPREALEALAASLPQDKPVGPPAPPVPPTT